ncbi:glutaminase [Dermatophilus congolensis]|nr:glutaminase [Dermatophilus congolensis]MBO3143807.1 glutaminase [Dermatophilus congolensis]MBO3152798.1 glutaminase [Dermatophilus congolensis]MBO3160192.1 glutaminase [Dermatophilus congolensis]MBO3177628.1 glutaminase [Dermatophilus congolensis]MBO3184400.1 glutaminase [Dermatophilus congolensis]
MRSMIPDYVRQICETCSDAWLAGENAHYIPELAKQDPSLFGVALSTVDGQVYAVGDTEVEFTIQSISKPFVYAMALVDRGLPELAAYIGVEPSGEAFNELSLDVGSKRPLNPMINAGALTAHALVGGVGDGADARFERIRAGMSAFAGRELSLDQDVFESELQTAYRNRALANMLRGYEVLPDEPEDVVRGYTMQCALRVTVRDLALMAATLANGGVQPLTGEQVVLAPVVRQVMSVMFACGMYDEAGEWITSVGIPAKSGVGGGIIGALPGQLGVATLSPPLDAHGNSVRGVEVFQRLSGDMGMHLMEVPPPAMSVVRFAGPVQVAGGVVFVYDLQGALRFAAVERVVRMVSDEGPSERTVVFDLIDVPQLDDVARRMLLELARRMTLEGYDVWWVGWRGPVPWPGEGGSLRLADSLDEVVL